MLTPELLRAATGSTTAAADLYAPHLGAACAHYGIDTAQRMAAFLTQIGHETLGLRYAREIADGKAYEGRRDLGNTEPGDGPRFKGRGLIQLTGRSNYRATAARMQDVGAPDFEALPESVADAKWAAWTAAEWWHHHGCNRLADAGNIVGLGRLINRGNADSRFEANGEADRLRRWDVARAALAGWQPAPAPEVPDLAPDAPPEVAPAPPAPEPEPPAQPAPPPTYTIPAGEAGDWQPPEASMPITPIVAALLPTLIESIPKLGKLFGSGSAVAERNVAAATMAMEIAQEAVGARNAQEAVETIKADPGAAQVAAKAIESRWLELTESGGGGIEGARKADAEARAGRDMLHSPSFWVALLMLPMVYLLILSLIGLIGTATWSDDVRAGLAGSIVSAVIGGLVGYYYGQTTSRNRS